MNSGFKTSRDRYLNVLLLGDDLIRIQNNEPALQESVYKLHEISKQHNTKVFTIKSKVMTFRGNKTVRTKTIINNQVIGRVTIQNLSDNVERSNNFENYIDYEKNHDIDTKLSKFQKTVNNQ